MRRPIATPVLSDDRKHVVADHVAFNSPSGVLAVVAAPDGRIFFSDPSGIYRLVQG